MNQTVPDKPTAAQIQCIRRAAGRIPGEDVWTSRPDVVERCEVAGWIDRESGPDGQWFATPAGLAAIEPQPAAAEAGTVRADQIQPGAILPLATDDPPYTGLHEVVAATPYSDADGDPMAALTVTLLGGGNPDIVRFPAGALVALATEAEIAEHRDSDRRRELAAALVDLAERIERDRLPIGYHYIKFVLGDRSELERWTASYGLPAPPITPGVIPLVKAGPYSVVEVQCRADAIETSTGDTSPSVAGAAGGTGPAAPSGPEVPASGPDNPVEHCQVYGYAGCGESGVECACGVSFDGYQHIADATASAVPMADCTEPATERIEVYRLDGGRIGTVYPCTVHRGEAMAALLAAGLRARTAGGVSGEPCGYEVNYITAGRSLLAPTKTAAEGARDTTTSADARRTPRGYDPTPTILARTPDEMQDQIAAYASGLDDSHPGWHWDDTEWMSSELAREAQARREADGLERPYRCEGCGKTSRIVAHMPGCPVAAAFDARLRGTVL
ncbi:hypothetical protein O7626_39410 [Micromonospora sp. WMMD1102]|uniref:hypothetical protein n=1 Tax=Micromonospora sp. WMMD1102 TaxID=3016105 RepID=UPI002414D3EE|nr:hypothetical protein [Micromonospora sp. WMMD1102]MDG4791884.1 hypothetical protein [Micromonospora sp. WMMD1102]